MPDKRISELAERGGLTLSDYLEILGDAGGSPTAWENYKATLAELQALIEANLGTLATQGADAVAITGGSGADLTLTRPIIGVTTWANRPAAASYSGAIIRISDVGASGALFLSDGTIWLPVNSILSLDDLGAAVTGIGTTETIVLQALLPAGLWQSYNRVRAWVSLTRSGTTDALRGALLVGTAGTTADTAIFNNIAFLTSTERSQGYLREIKLVSATSVLLTGGNGGGLQWFDAGTGVQSPVTISDVDQNPIYISFTIKSNGSTDTVGIDAGHLELLTP